MKIVKADFFYCFQTYKKALHYKRISTIMRGSEYGIKCYCKRSRQKQKMQKKVEKLWSYKGKKSPF